jgi:3-dehydrosphinganine reductase
MFKDKTIIITGGSSGLGKALAERFIRSGANLALVARDKKKLKSVQAELVKMSQKSQKVEIYSCDVSRADDVDKTVKAIVESFGPPDILINCAGILRESHFEKESIETFREVMSINFFGTLHFVKAVLPHFKQKGRGRIVNISSMAGLTGVFGYSAYCASKFAIAGLSSTIRGELKPQNIVVQVVYPPEFDSPMVDEINTYRSYENEMLAHTIPPLGLDVVADSVIEGIEKSRPEIIPGRLARLLALGNRVFPSMSRLVVDARIRKFYGKPRNM